MRSAEDRQSIHLAWPIAIVALGGGALAFLFLIVPRLERGWADTGRQLSVFEMEWVRASHFVVGWPWLVLTGLLVLVALAVAVPRISDRARP